MDTNPPRARGSGVSPQPAFTDSHSQQPAASGSHHVVSVPEGSTAAALRRALAPLPTQARLVDFSSDTEVILVFAVDDPRWPAPPERPDQPGPAG